MRCRPWRAAARAGAALTLTGLLVGCSAAPDLSERAADRLGGAVSEVVAAAEDGRYEAAVAGLVAVRSELDRAADAGEVSVERYRQIDAALARTEAELAAAIAAAAPPAAPEPGSEGVTGPQEEAGGGTEPAGDGEDAGDGDGPGKGRGNGVGPEGDRGRGNGP